MKIFIIENLKETFNSLSKYQNTECKINTCKTMKIMHIMTKMAKFIDNVDYERRLPDKLKSIYKTYINNHGYNMQEKGNSENYYIVMDILLDDSIDELKKKNLLQKILRD